MRSAFSKSLVILSAAKDPAGSNWMSCFHSTGFFAALRMTAILDACRREMRSPSLSVRIERRFLLFLQIP